MQYNLKTVLKLLVLLTIPFGISGCGDEYLPIKWNPDFYVGDYLNAQIQNEGGRVIKVNTSEFNNYGCLHVEKIVELRDILDEAVVPKGLKNYQTFYLKNLNTTIARIRVKK